MKKAIIAVSIFLITNITLAQQGKGNNEKDKKNQTETPEQTSDKEDKTDKGENNKPQQENQKSYKPEKENQSNGNEYGKDKGEVDGKEFGQDRADQAKKMQMSKNKMLNNTFLKVRKKSRSTKKNMNTF